jgi:hypothetical protein
MKFAGLVAKVGKVQKIRVLLLISVIYVSNFVLLIIEFYTTEDLEIIIRGIRTLPTLIVTLIDALNFERKSIGIEELLNDLSAIVKEQNEEQVFETSYRKIMTYN